MKRVAVEAGVVHEDVELSELADGLLDQALGVFRLADVRLDRDRLAAAGFDLRLQRLGLFSARVVVDRDGRALLRKRAR